MAISAGQRGMQIVLSPQDLIKTTKAVAGRLGAMIED